MVNLRGIAVLVEPDRDPTRNERINIFAVNLVGSENLVGFVGSEIWSGHRMNLFSECLVGF